MSSRSPKPDVERTRFGISKLDDIIGGGLPAGGITLVAGGPGTGKTILAAQYLYNGATKYNEKGLYVIFSETAETFRKYMGSLGWDFRKLENEDKICIMDMATMEKEAVDATLDMILDKVTAFGAKRVVIDSVTALTLVLGDKAKARVMVSLLQKFLRQNSCTTLLITETPWGGNGIGAGVEEFIADGIILLEMVPDEINRNLFRRRLVILKMRATEHNMNYYAFTIAKEKGVDVIPYPETLG